MVAGAIINAEYEWKIKYLQTSEENLKKERPKFKEKKEKDRERQRKRENVDEKDMSEKKR